MGLLYCKILLSGGHTTIIVDSTWKEAIQLAIFSPYTGAGVLLKNSNKREYSDNLNGVLVTQIDKDSPAHKAGVNASIINQFGNITGGDIITAVDGNPIIEADELSTYVRELKQVDNNITLTVYRNGDYLRLNATLEASPYNIPTSRIRCRWLRSYSPRLTPRVIEELIVESDLFLKLFSNR